MLTQAFFFVPYFSSFQIALWRVVEWLGLGREFFDGCLGREVGVYLGWPSGQPYFLDSWVGQRREIRSSIRWGVPP